MNNNFKVKGEVIPLDDDILAIEMETGSHVLASGLIISDDNGKNRGIRPRWAKVYKVGKNVTDVKPDEWILIDHGRWTYRHIVEVEKNGELVEIHLQKIDPSGIMIVTDENPENDKHAFVSKAMEMTGLER